MKAKDAFQYIQGIRAWPFSTNAKITGVMLSSRYNWTKMACAWPSNRIIASDTGLSISAVVKAKKELVNAGFLQVERQFNNSCKYTPMLPNNIGHILLNYTSVLQDHRVTPTTNLKDNIKDNIKEKLPNSNEFDNSINQIITGDIIDVSSETIASGTALRKELTPAEIDELLSW